jgi:ubiquitin C-terminal hydrolase
MSSPLPTSRPVTCPLCHTSHAWLTQEALQTGESWRCVRCAQQWDNRRLVAVAAYADWVAAQPGTTAANP